MLAGTHMAHRSLVWGLALGVSVGLAAVAQVGCSAVADDEPGLSVDNLENADPILPADLVECWVVASTERDPFFQAHEVKCAAKMPPKYPLVAERFTVEAFTARGNVLSGMFSDGEKSLGRVRNDEFPLELKTRISFARTGEIGDGFTLKHVDTIATLAATSPIAKLAIKVPLTLWPLEIKSPEGRRLVLTARYTVPTKGFRVGANFNIPETDPEELALRPFLELPGGKKEFFFVAPASGAIDVNVHGVAAKIPGPGTYVWDGQTLTTDANDKPSTPPPVGSTPTPAPSCGTNGQAPCEGGQCAPSHQLESGTCVACGGDGEKYCQAANGARSCKDGHRLDSSTAKCLACGASGQTYCADAAGARSCNAGLRLDSNTAKCLDCGADTQTYCSDASGARLCDPGHRYDSNAATCKVCGADGQTYCSNASGARFCNDGHRYDSNAATCKVCGGEGQTYCSDAAGAPFCSPGLRYNASTATCVR
jgi:hypothetical protein